MSAVSVVLILLIYAYFAISEGHWNAFNDREGD